MIYWVSTAYNTICNGHTNKALFANGGQIAYYDDYVLRMYYIMLPAKSYFRKNQWIWTNQG